LETSVVHYESIDSLILDLSDQAEVFLLLLEENKLQPRLGAGQERQTDNAHIPLK